jgi:hypothetical protein
METSILKSTKKILGIGLDDDSFDLDIVTHINSAFSTLHQLGIGPVDGFVIEDEDAEWADFGVTKIPILSQLKTCVYLQVKMLFDPPGTSYLIDSLNKQLGEQQWRLSVMREETGWIDPDPPGQDDEEEVVSGGFGL